MSVITDPYPWFHNFRMRNEFVCVKRAWISINKDRIHCTLCKFEQWNKQSNTQSYKKVRIENRHRHYTKLLITTIYFAQYAITRSAQNKVIFRFKCQICILSKTTSLKPHYYPHANMKSSAYWNETVQCATWDQWLHQSYKGSNQPLQNIIV